MPLALVWCASLLSVFSCHHTLLVRLSGEVQGEPWLLMYK